MAAPDACLDMITWRKAWGEEEWRKFLEAGENEEELSALRRSTYTGHPLGSDQFISALEKRTARRLRPGKGGRPRKPPHDKEPAATTLRNSSGKTRKTKTENQKTWCLSPVFASPVFPASSGL
jgi:hypothetical protein